MPTFQGLVTEENILQLIEYIKSLSSKPAAASTVQKTVNGSNGTGAVRSK